MRAAMIALRLVHVLSGVFWAGSAVALAAFVSPAIRASGPAGGQVMRELMQRRRLGIALSVAAALTILSGSAMYWVIASGMQRAWLGSPMGMTLGFGAIAAISAAFLGAAVASPTASRLEALTARAEHTDPAAMPAQRAALAAAHARLARSSVAAAALLVVAAAAMAVARYV